MTSRRQPNSRAMALAARFCRDEEGASAVEYGLLASLIAAAIIGILGQMGGRLRETFTRVYQGMQTQ